MAQELVLVAFELGSADDIAPGNHRRRGLVMVLAVAARYPARSCGANLQWQRL
jgi:hypothetical protein